VEKVKYREFPRLEVQLPVQVTAVTLYTEESNAAIELDKPLDITHAFLQLLEEK